MLSSKTFDSDVDVQISHGSLTQYFGVLFGPFVGANKSVLFGTPTAEDQSPSRSPILFNLMIMSFTFLMEF